MMKNKLVGPPPTSGHVKSRHSTSTSRRYHVQSRPITLNHVESRPSRQITSNHVESRRITSNHVVSRRITSMSRRITSNHIKPRRITSNHSNKCFYISFITKCLIKSATFHISPWYAELSIRALFAVSTRLFEDFQFLSTSAHTLRMLENIEETHSHR